MLIEELRKHTAEAHQQVEKIVINRLKNIKQPADYVHLLNVFYAYFNQLEQAIQPYITADILPDYTERRHAAILAADIGSFGYLSTTALPASVPPIDSSIKALAALYVMEGSIMGGPIIIQVLARHGIQQGTLFFAGYGADSKRKWETFTAALHKHIPEEHFAVAIATAIVTFTQFAETFKLAASKG
ncbi:biliverdin-producing heme oxygenase [Sphingobacterium sp. Mn56C]|uniref:biliverdin-producing heme oxygenase n=1 Tax=Sphingobacterium sp. Mn56C TaxID=3395261 RepID=UPI003BBD3A7C